MRPTFSACHLVPGLRVHRLFGIVQHRAFCITVEVGRLDDSLAWPTLQFSLALLSFFVGIRQASR